MAVAIDASKRSAVLVVRAWIEGDPAIGLRVRVTEAVDNAAPEYLVTTAANIDDVCAGIRDWLESLIATQTPVRPRVVS